MKSVDPGVLSHSTCFSFTPSAIAEKLYFYIPWCGHYFCTSKYFMKRDYYFAFCSLSTYVRDVFTFSIEITLIML